MKETKNTRTTKTTANTKNKKEKNAMKKNNEERIPRNEYIEKLSLNSNKINMTNNNRKTGIACLNFAFPLCTCREDAPCKETCYANKGRQITCTVQGAYYRNLRLMNEDMDDLFEQIAFEIKHNGLNMVRFFDSGDIPNAEFFEKMCETIRRFPDVKFMAFTKKYEIVNEYLAQGNTIPNNFNIMFSAWDYTWKFDNPFNLPVAYVKFKDERLNPDIPKYALNCPSNGKKVGEVTCSMCKACWNKKLKAVYFEEH